MFTGGTLSPGESCTFSVTLAVPAGATAGTHPNATSTVLATVEGIAATSAPAADDLNVSGITFSKEFIDDPVTPGDTVTLRFTIENVHSSQDATGMFFLDSLDSVVSGLASTSGTLMDVCGSGSQLTGTSLLIFTGGNLMQGDPPCSFDVTVAVPGAAPDGTFANVTSNLTATQGPGGVTVDPAVDTLVLNSDLLQLTKEFTDDPVLPGAEATLVFTLTNLSDSDASAVAFTDDLDGVLTGMTGVGVSNDCPSGMLGGGSTLSFSGGAVNANSSCTITATVTVPGSVSAGTVATNTTSGLTGTIEGFSVTGAPAGDDLHIGIVTFSKTFLGTPQAGETVDLSFTITNLSTTDTVSSIGFTDDLDAVISGLVATGLPQSDVCGTGSQLAGGSFLTLIAGTLLPMGSCTIPVTLQLPGVVAIGEYLNQSSELSAGGLPTAPAATATLQVVGSITNSATVTASGAAPVTAETTDPVLP